MPDGSTKAIEKKLVSAVVKQYGIGLSALKLPVGTLYSCLDKLPKAIKPTAAQTEKEMENAAKLYPSITNCIQTKESSFVLTPESIASDSYLDIDEAHGLIKLSNWSLGQGSPIDIAVEDAKRFTNTTGIEDACMLLELACSAGALTMYCVHNPYRRSNREENPVKSVFFGAPVIDTRKLLGGVNAPDAGALAEFDEVRKNVFMCPIERMMLIEIPWHCRRHYHVIYVSI